MWEINVGLQALGLIYSLLLGICAALLYDILRAIHKSFCCKTVSVFLLDVLYWLILTLLFFSFFMVFTNGQVRLYALWGAVAGFIFSRLTLSRIWLSIFCKILLLFKFLMGKLAALFRLLGGIFIKFLKNIKKTLKKGVLKTKKA